MADNPSGKGGAKPRETEPSTSNTATGQPRRMRAVCPVSPEHNAKVYRTSGRTRNCKCDTCGQLWKQVGRAYTPAGDAALQLRDLISDAIKRPSEINSRQCVVLTLERAKSVVALCDQIAGDESLDDEPAKG